MPKVVYGVEIYGFAYTEPVQMEGAKRFIACLGMYDML